MSLNHIDIERAARLERAKAISGLIATAIAWIKSHPRRRHAARPHFAR